MDTEKIIKRILFPNSLVLCLVSVTAFAMLGYGFAAYETTDIFSIVSYVLSFYALVLICLRIPDLLRFINRFRAENRYYALYKSDVLLRVNLSLYGAFIFNSAYSVFQLALGFRHRSVWFFAMAGYYFLLACMRLMIARTIREHVPGENQKAEWRKYRMCGALLMVMNLTLLVFVLYFVFRIRIFMHHEITTIAMAVYTFSALGIAIYNAVRYKRYGSPAYSAAKAISLTSAAVSMLTLENAMLTTFGRQSGELFVQIMLGISGTVLILLVMAIALYMVINATKHLEKS